MERYNALTEEYDKKDFRDSAIGYIFDVTFSYLTPRLLTMSEQSMCEESPDFMIISTSLPCCDKKPGSHMLRNRTASSY